ncbi:hypothetical protein ACTA71_001795 [Dictyostelium dimigraforme]
MNIIKFNSRSFYLFLLKFLLFYISFSLSSFDPEQQQPIDTLIGLYNLPPIENNNYCGLPDNFKCDKNQTTILSINLSGSVTNKPNFPDQIIGAFKNVSQIKISNSNFTLDFFKEYPGTLSNLTLESCNIPKFPDSLKNVKSLYMYDLLFSGNITTSSISSLLVFKLKYSSSDLISDYQFINDGGSVPKPSVSYEITMNNIYQFFNNTFLNVIIILGTHFNQDSLVNIKTIYSTTLTIIDIGFYGIPVGVDDFSFNVANLNFENIQFNLQSDQDYLDFTNCTAKLIQMEINNCTGLTNSTGDLRVLIGSSVNFLGIINSNLIKLPPTSFYVGKFQAISFQGNKITGSLPDIPEPNSREEVISFDFSRNLFTGSIPENYCYHYGNVSNNLLDGSLPMCFICILNDFYLRSTIENNDFPSFSRGSTSNFPKCTGISFSSKLPITSGDISIVNGTNFGWNSFNPKYFPYPFTSNPNLDLLLVIPNKQISIGVASAVELEILKKTNFSSDVLFLIPNITIKIELDVSKPLIKQVYAFPFYNSGYTFIIHGIGFSYQSDSSSQTIVTLGDYKCSVTVTLGNYIDCRVYEKQLAEKVYTITVKNNQTNLSGSYQYKFQRTYPYITAIDPPTTNGGIVIVYGSYGPNHTVVDLMIGQQQCIINNMNSSVIQCSIGGGTGAQNVSLTVDGVNWAANDYFRYKDQELSCPGSPPCDGNGDCLNGYCVCDGGFGGEVCKQIFIDDPVIRRNDTLTEILKNGYSFGFSIKDIREIDFTGKTVRLHNFTSWSLAQGSTIQKWTYINYIGDNSIISYTIEQITGQPKNYTFAGEQFTLQPGSLKLSANISNWEYLGPLNTLQLQIQSSVKAQQESECEQKSKINSNGDGVSLNYITIQKDKNVFSGRFIDKVVSDGRPTFSKVSISEQTQDSITVSISLPYCKECLIDPDFSVLLSEDDSSGDPCDGHGASSRLKWVIPTSIILGLLGITGIAIGAYFLLRNKFYVSRSGVIILKKSTKKQSIDRILPKYGLNLINGDYCGSPQYFKCDDQNETIREISLNGDEINKTIFPDGVIGNFYSLIKVMLSNSNISNSFFGEVTSITNFLEFNNCFIPQFPTLPPFTYSLNMNNVFFNGNINYSSFSTISNFKLYYSSGDLMTDYQIIDDSPQQFIASTVSIVINNVIDFKHPFQKLELSLGKYFSYGDNFKELSFTGSPLSVSDLYFNKPVEITNVNYQGPLLNFYNIQFNSTNGYLDFTNSLATSLVFINCSGLTNSNDDLMIKLGNTQNLAILNSRLKKIPPFSYYEKLISIDLSGNNIIGQIPELYEPINRTSSKTINLSGNQINGELTQNHCYHNLNLSNNLMTGKLPMCYICQLNDPQLRYRINGNNFQNYISGSENNFPSCSGVSFGGIAMIDIASQKSFINGTNLGWQSSYYGSGQIVSDPKGLTFLIEVPNKLLRIIDAKNYFPIDKAIINFKIPNVNATLYFNFLEPTINEFEVFPYYNLGYLFLITGSGFPNENSTSSRVSIKFDNFDCVPSSVTNNAIECKLYRSQLAEKIYTVKITNEQTGKTGIAQYKFERTYPYVYAVYTPMKTGGMVTLFGSYGTIFTTVDVLIGKGRCTIITINATIITCNIGGIDSIGPSPANLSLSINNVTWFASDYFVFNEDNICPGTPQCSGNGVCFSGFCACTNGYSGIKCNQIFTGDIEVKKNDTLTEMIKNGYSFGFSIKDIREIDFTGKTVRQHNFTSWFLTEDSTIQKWTYVNRFENSIISYTVEQITGESKNYTFAGEQFTLQPGSLKLSANISNWEYLGSLNVLQLQIQSSVKAQQESECEQKSDIQSNINGVSLNYITIQKDKNVFSGRFIDKVVSDGRPTFSKVSISEQTQDSITVSISLPYCKECLIDPDFSVMINPNPTSNPCDRDQPSRLKWVVPVSVILGLLGLFGIFALVFFLARDRIYISKKGGVILLKKTKKNTTINE